MNPIHQCLAWQSMDDEPFLVRDWISLRVFMLVIEAGRHICPSLIPVVVLNIVEDSFTGLRRDGGRAFLLVTEGIEERR